MSGIALGIVLASAFLHAGWNYLLKKSDRKIVFIWWFQLLALFFCLPAFLYCYPKDAIPPAGWACIVATGLIHAAYFWVMGGAYQRGDLSMVYPLARGSGPLFVPILAMVLLREEVSALGMAGIALIVGGIYCVHLRAFSASAFLEPFRALRGGASLWALLTGLSIAAYTLVDKVGVALVYPVVYIYGMFLITWLTLTPWILLRERSFLASEWRRHTGPIFIVGFLSGFTYLMVLFALQISKVSYVAAVREVSIILSAYLGIVWLGEKHGRQKLVGAILITAGVVAIGLSR
ncbi:MAG: DMT family transporter [Deltaproteobacteria bacterium]|nr:DMT family transporter [Deltaproteobacteria bacterium]